MPSHRRRVSTAGARLALSGGYAFATPQAPTKPATLVARFRCLKKKAFLARCAPETLAVPTLTSKALASPSDNRSGWNRRVTPRRGREKPRPCGPGGGGEGLGSWVWALSPVPASRAAVEPPPRQACRPARQTVPGRPETYAARRPRGPTWCSLPRRFSAHQKPRLSSAVWAAR